MHTEAITTTTAAGEQAPDTRPGAYYVSVIDGPRCALLVGPFINNHAGALAIVDAVRLKACDLDARGVFYAYGTCRLPLEGATLRAGSLNAYFHKD